MLEHLPRWIGALMHNVRAGHSKLVIAEPGLDLGQMTLDLSSPAFANGARFPARFTADGEGLSPPLVWGDVPAGADSLALIVEDPDAPALNPMVHALVWGIPPSERALPEGAIRGDGAGSSDGRDVGRNSMLSEGWLPPDPPSGHGPHDYVFQLFALSGAREVGPNPGRLDFVRAISGHIVAAGMLVGTYSRGEPAAASPGQAALRGNAA